MHHSLHSLILLYTVADIAAGNFYGKKYPETSGVCNVLKTYLHSPWLSLIRGEDVSCPVLCYRYISRLRGLSSKEVKTARCIGYGLTGSMYKAVLYVVVSSVRGTVISSI